MTRAEILQQAHERREPWDFVVIGGGATGAGIAVDAASRGYSVLLVEQHDFGKGTSSRSTKLVHGGVRYLERGDVSLVREALRERGRLVRNAPHLVRVQSFIVPVYRWWEAPFYGLGLKAYDLLSGRWRIGVSKYLPRREVLARIPTIQSHGLRGGILYHDGQFDDSRLLINLVQTAVEQGAVTMNYAKAVRFLKTGNRIDGVVVRDEESGDEFEAKGRAVLNATGAFCDGVRAMADPGAAPMVAPSQGTHLVFNRAVVPGETAIMVPKTSDGRVLFAIPWHGYTVVGTTDVGIPSATLEPTATDGEVQFILETLNRYLAKPVTRGDVKSVFVGIRPLVKATGAANTAALSRDHVIRVEPGGLVTVTGGKWTTYRNMAEDAVTRAAALAGLPAKACGTGELRIHGSAAATGDSLSVYGSDAAGIRELQQDTALASPLHPAMPITGAEVVWAARHECARTVEDVLARRTRALFLDASAARAMAPRVAELLAKELGRDAAWRSRQLEEFDAMSRGYIIAAT